MHYEGELLNDCNDDTRRVRKPGVRLGLSEWRSGGTMLVTAMVCYACSSFPLSVIGILIKPLGLQFGWSRASVASSVLITAIGTMLFAPVIGHVVDRLGPRRVGLVGLLLLSGGVALIGASNHRVASWYLYWTIYAIAQACAGNVIWANAVVSRFDRNRGLALAILLTGQALSFGFMPRLGVVVLSTLGWRALFFIFASFTLLVAWPLAYRFFYGAIDLHRRRARAGDPPAPAPIGTGLLQIIWKRQFWQMALAFAIASAAVSALFVHLQPILTDSGATAEQAATVALILAPASILGRFCSGYLLDRFAPNLIAALALGLSGISYAILMLGGTSSLIGAAVCALFLGVTAGAESDLLAYLVSRYFGRASFGKTYGILLGIYALGYGLAPVAAGAVFDSTASYKPIFLVFMIGALLGAILIGTLGAPSTTEAVRER
jgi:predicted MFS family arabinose efflux permease